MTPDKYIKNYINGTLVSAASGKYLDNINPATGRVYSFIPDSDASDVQRAVESAERAFPVWSTCGVRKRFRILMRIADIIEQNLENFAKAESIDTGKPLGMTRSTVIPRAHANFRFFATAILHFNAEAHQMEGEAINFTLRQPIGIVSCISPSCLPLYFFTWKIAPALAAGNCVIAKPSELTPMTAYLLAQACIEAGLPPGVLNIINGRGTKTAQVMVEHPKISAISFTGSTDIGRIVAQTAAPLFKRVLLEMSGKNATVVFADCDFNQMLLGVLRSSFSNSGQICLCQSRIFVERPIYQKFKDEFVKRSQYLKIGDPFSAVTDLGSLSSAEQLQKSKGYIALAQVEGARLLAGAEPLAIKTEYQEGFFLRPTILENVPHQSRFNQEEIFGPVVSLAPFDTEEELIQLVNDSNYGLNASVWSKDISKANRIVEQLNVGTVWVNCWMVWDLRAPHGGHKSSGVGREGGMEALRFFTEPKNVCVKY